jgi:MoaA/NifB/PqqE/SkfB family radical SAM enzyme
MTVAPPIVSGWEFRNLRTRLWMRAAVTALRGAGGALAAVRALRRIQTWTGVIRSGNTLRKAARVGRRYTLDIYMPAFPSPAASRFLTQEIRRHHDNAGGNVLQTAIIAITKECPLRCEHCCEWENLNRPDTVGSAELQTMVHRLAARGVTQIFFSGGEPLRRLDDLLAACASVSSSVDCWVITSGVGLTPLVAGRLAEAGLTGVVISVDHWNAEEHDAFRGRRGVFDAAMHASAHAAAAGLTVAFSLCPTRALATREHLERYAELARSRGAAFIQIMEPRQVGHYADRDVLLGAEEIATLETWHDWMNFDPANAGAPIVTYPALLQRRAGCLGAAERYFYVDTNGDAHACPFCRNPAANVVREGVDAAVDALRARGCGGC